MLVTSTSAPPISSSAGHPITTTRRRHATLYQLGMTISHERLWYSMHIFIAKLESRFFTYAPYFFLSIYNIFQLAQNYQHS